MTITVIRSIIVITGDSPCPSMKQCSSMRQVAELARSDVRLIAGHSTSLVLHRPGGGGAHGSVAVAGGDRGERSRRHERRARIPITSANRPTIKEVALVSGVSTATVSRALSGGSPVSPDQTARMTRVVR